MDCEPCSAVGRRTSACVRMSGDGKAVCRDCFFAVFEQQVHQTIVANELFSTGDKVAVGASGGKDSTVLAYLLNLLNQRHDYGIEPILLSIDEGIAGYRDDSLEAVKRNAQQYQLPLKILSYSDLYGWTMDRVVEKIGRKNNCTFCGVFRRQALDRGAKQLAVSKIVTGHNADDVAETVIMNILRGDVARLERCTNIMTSAGDGQLLPRCKPLKYSFEKEIVMYAHFKKLDYFSTECIYSPNAYRGYARSYIKQVERIRPRAILDIIRSAELLAAKDAETLPKQMTCRRCGYISSQPLCKACLLLEGLNSDRPMLALKKSAKRKGTLAVSIDDNSEKDSSVTRTYDNIHAAVCTCDSGNANIVDF